MEQNSRLPEIIDYLKANPSVPDGGQHVHIHYHEAPAPPPPPPRGPTAAEQIIPWLWVGLASCIILTICSVILAAVIVALVLGMVALTLFAAVVAYLIKTTRESQVNTDLAHAALSKNRRQR